MARDGSGNYSLPYAAFVAGTTIESAKVNGDLSDIAAALTASIAKDGQTVPTANLPMGGFKHTNVADGSSRTDYASLGQVAKGTLLYAADTGAADAYAIAPSPGIAANVVGYLARFKVANANLTTTPTLAVNSLTAGTIVWPDGSALAAGDLPANALVECICAALSGSTPTWHLMTVPSPVTKAGAQTIAGAKTFSALVAMSGAAINEAAWVDVASATTTDIGAAASNAVRITGTTTITGLGTVQSGTRRKVRFAAALTLTHDGTALILPNNGSNITTAAGDTAEFESLGSGNWICTEYTRASGQPIAGGTGASWTPADGSGASLSFTSVAASYVQIGNLIHAHFTLTFPSTADGTQILISGLPVACANADRAQVPSLVRVIGGSATIMAVPIKNTTTFNLFANNAAFANASASTLTFRGLIIYPVS